MSKKWTIVHSNMNKDIVLRDLQEKIVDTAKPETEKERHADELIECYIDCVDEATWTIKVNDTTCSGIKQLRTGSKLEVRVYIGIHAVETVV